MPGGLKWSGRTQAAACVGRGKPRNAAQRGPPALHPETLCPQSRRRQWEQRLGPSYHQRWCQNSLLFSPFCQRWWDCLVQNQRVGLDICLIVSQDQQMQCQGGDLQRGHGNKSQEGPGALGSRLGLAVDLCVTGRLSPSVSLALPQAEMSNT